MPIFPTRKVGYVGRRIEKDSPMLLIPEYKPRNIDSILNFEIEVTRRVSYEEATRDFSFAAALEPETPPRGRRRHTRVKVDLAGSIPDNGHCKRAVRMTPSGVAADSE